MREVPPWQETGELLPWRAVVVETPELIVMLTGFVAYTTGLSFVVEGRSSRAWALREVLCSPQPSVEELVRGLEGSATPDEVSDLMELGLKISAPSAANDLTAQLLFGHGVPHSYEQWWWLGPLPEGDSLALTVTFRVPELPTAELRFDARELRAAAARSRLWGRGSAGPA